ncbi:hypothetical protein E2C01_098633 [Portunus trituberculatus]|uniref:Uncharacterized protein n=1 Tax=Portunus trituberculatus TaxID=210409 RepID=A0A5B7KCL1_PORTR|nr:hypothetical protein [Portunus trituberculatus]
MNTTRNTTSESPPNMTLQQVLWCLIKKEKKPQTNTRRSNIHRPEETNHESSNQKASRPPYTQTSQRSLTTIQSQDALNKPTADLSITNLT